MKKIVNNKKDRKNNSIDKSKLCIMTFINIIMFFILILKFIENDASEIYIYVYIFSIIILFLKAVVVYFNKKYAKDLIYPDIPAKKEIFVKKLMNVNTNEYCEIKLGELEKNDIILLNKGEIIPCNGTVIKGAALLDESCITGESAAVLVDSESKRNRIKKGTKLLSDFLFIKVDLDGIEKDDLLKKKDINYNNENNKINKITIIEIFMLITIVILYQQNNNIEMLDIIFYTLAMSNIVFTNSISSVLKLLKLFKSEILSYYNIDLRNINSIDKFEEIKTILIDKTGTITFGNREAIKIYTAPGITEDEAADIAYISSANDDTPEGKSIFVYIKQLYSLRGKYINKGEKNIKEIPFSAITRISGCDVDGVKIRKGDEKAIREFVRKNDGFYPEECSKISKKISLEGGTPLSIAVENKVYGVIYLKDTIKEGLKKSFEEIKNNGYSIILATGDNPLTTATIAAECGINNFISEATPKTKLDFVEECQSYGDKIAVIGDGENDIKALQNADFSLVMGNSSNRIKYFGDAIDNDSNPSKIQTIIKISKEILRSKKLIKFMYFLKDFVNTIILLTLILFILTMNKYLDIGIISGYLLSMNIIVSILIILAIIFHKK